MYQIYIAFLIPCFAFSCPDIAGDYHCPKSDDYPESEARIQHDSSKPSFTLEGIISEEPKEYLADGSWQPVQEGVRYQARCGVNDFNISFEISVNDETKNAAVGIRKTSDGILISTTNVLGDRKSQACNKK